MHIRDVHRRLGACFVIACLSSSAIANHAPGHGDPDPYNCTVLVEKPNGRLEESQLDKLDCILHKLDRIERRMGCPLDDYLAGECPYSPADTTATFCISQGREGGIDAEFGAEAHAEYDLGVGWPNVAWAKAIGKVEHPVIVPPFIPIPTELNITGAASLGRNFDICLEVPLEAAEALGPLELYSDAYLIDAVVRAINEPQRGAKSKFQRRLGRLANYAILRVPGTDRFGVFQLNSDKSELALLMDDDGESEFDLADDAIERLMAGDFGLAGDGGPMEVLKSTVVQDLSAVLELPAPVGQVLADPDMVIGRIFELGLLGGQAGSMPMSAAGLSGTGICETFGLSAPLRDRFPQVDAFCGLFSGLPTFAQTTGIFAVVAIIRNIVAALPTLDDINSASCTIAGWGCPEE